MFYKIGALKKIDALQNRRAEVFCKKNVPENFAKFTGKHLCWSLFLTKFQVSGLQFAKNTPAQEFFCEFCEIFRNIFFTEHLRTTTSVTTQKSRNQTIYNHQPWVWAHCSGHRVILPRRVTIISNNITWWCCSKV